MQSIAKLSNLFRPVQPRFKEGGSEVIYTEAMPDIALSGLVCCYWQLRSDGPLEKTFRYNAVADGCIDFFFDVTDPREAFVMGFSSGCTAFELKKSFCFAGVRFFPGAFPLLYRVEASALTNQCYHIRDVIAGDFPVKDDQLTTGFSFDRFKLCFDNYFKKIVSGLKIEADLRFTESLYQIFQSLGAVTLNKAIFSSVSPRQLRRLFDYYVGAGPKEFHRIARFQEILKRAKTREIMRHDKPYFDLGYYDQSHFIKEYTLLYGASPLKTVY